MRRRFLQTKKTMSFFLEDVEYTAHIGMTWAEWAASDLNTGYFVSSIGNFPIHIQGEAVMFYNLYYVTAVNGKRVYAGDFIIGMSHYYLEQN